MSWDLKPLNSKRVCFVFITIIKDGQKTQTEKDEYMNRSQRKSPVNQIFKKQKCGECVSFLVVNFAFSFISSDNIFLNRGSSTNTKDKEQNTKIIFRQVRCVFLHFSTNFDWIGHNVIYVLWPFKGNMKRTKYEKTNYHICTKNTNQPFQSVELFQDAAEDISGKLSSSHCFYHQRPLEASWYKLLFS